MKKMTGLVVLAIGGMTLLAIQKAVAAGEGDPVRLSVDIGMEYTDNRDSMPDGEENVDFFLTPRLDALFRAPEDRTVLDLHYAPSYRYRTEPSDIQNDTELQHDLGMDLVHKFTQVFGAHLMEQFNVTDDPAIVQDGTTLRRDSSYTMNRAGAGVSVRPNRTTELSLDGNHMVKMYDEKEVAVESDEESMGGKIQYWWAVVKNFGLLAEGSVTEYDYDSSRGLERGFRSTSAGLGLKTQVSATTAASVVGGVTTLEYNDDMMGDETGPYVNAMLEISPLPTQIRLNGSYGLRDSDAYPYASQEYTAMTLDVDWEANRVVKFGVSGGYRLGTYERDDAPVTATDPTYVRPSGGDETTVLGEARMTFVISEFTSIKLAQSYQDVDSDVSTTFTRNATRLSVWKKF